MPQITRIAEKIRRSGMRVSMHPGQYTVLNSPDGGVVHRAMRDLSYHARVLDALGLGVSHKIILHVGGKYGDAISARTRFAAAFRDLDPAVSRRIALENDGSIFNISEVLDLCCAIGAPAVYDNLHNAIHPADPLKSDDHWVSLCRATWNPSDGAQKTHYSQQDPDKPRGAHSETVSISRFLEYDHGISGEKPDIMLEVKDKNRSAVKCQLCLSPPDQRLMETEWGRYKYCVLERSPEAYGEIRAMLKDKRGDSAIAFYTLVERALALPENKGRALNALEHVWGYFPECASKAEARRYAALRDGFAAGAVPLGQVKRLLYRFAQQYRQDYLLGSYYFLN